MKKYNRYFLLLFSAIITIMLGSCIISKAPPPPVINQKEYCISQTPEVLLDKTPMVFFPTAIPYPENNSTQPTLDEWENERNTNENYFLDKLKITARVGNASLEKRDFEAYEVYLDFFVTYTNVSSELLIIRVPEWATHSAPVLEFLYIEYKDDEGNRVLTQYNAGNGDFRPEAKDFILLRPSESYCEYYQDYFLLSDQENFSIDGEEIYLEHLSPGKYFAKVYYHNHISSHNNRFLNPWIGVTESEWTIFEIYLPQ